LKKKARISLKKTLIKEKEEELQFANKEFNLTLEYDIHHPLPA
jgi:hypothetical protein